MDIQEFLTYFINTFVLSSVLFVLIDFYFYLFNSWQQLNSSQGENIGFVRPGATTY